MAQEFNITDANPIDQSTANVTSSNPPTSNYGYRNEFNNPDFKPIQDAFELKPPDFEGKYNADFLNAVEMATAFNNYAPGGMSDYNSPAPGMATSSYDPLQQSTQTIDTSTVEGRKADLLKSFDNVGSEFNKQDVTPGLEDPFFFGIKRHNADRYYRQPAFSRLGFHPLQDNEAYYQANTGFYNDAISTGAQWMNMFGSQFFSPYRSIGDVINGDFLDPDDKGGGVMHEAMRLAGSQQGGLGGWVNDFLLNSAFSVGTLFNIAFEEALMAGASAAMTVPSGGTSWMPFLARTGHNLKRGLKASHGIFNMKDAASASMKLLEQMRNVEKARDMWTAVRMSGTIAADIFTPSISHAIRKLNTTAGTANGLSNLAKTSILFGGFYRQGRALNLALSEGKIEAGLVEINMKDKLYRQWHQENPNQNPTQKDIDTIEEFSKEAAWETTKWNLPIIYLSNRIVFGSAMKGFSSFKRAAVESGKRRGKQIGQSRLAKEASRPYIVLGEGFSNVWKRGFKEGITPAMYGGLYYLQANLAEGFQELAQESLAVGIEDYYMKMYNEPISFAAQRNQARIHDHILNGREEWLKNAYSESWNTGLESHMNWKGFGVFMSGFMMGGLMQSGQRAMKAGYDLYQRKSDPEAFDLYKENRNANLNADTENINDVWEDMNYYLGQDLVDVISQKQLDTDQYEASQNNDRMTYQNKKFDSIVQKLESVFSRGKQGDFKKKIKDELQMSDEDLLGAYPEEKSAAKTRQRLEKMLSRLNSYEKTYLEYTNRFINPANPWQFKLGTKEFAQEQSKLMMHNFFKNLAVYSQQKFQNAVERKVSIYNSFSADPVFSKISAFDVDLLLGTQEDINKQISLLEKDIKNSDPKTEDDKLILRRKQEKLKLIKNFASVKFNPNNLVDGVFKKQKAESLINPVTAYLKHVAEVNNDFVVSEKIEDAVVKIIDHEWLGAMGDMYHNAVAHMINPKRLNQLAEQSAPIYMKIWETMRDKNNLRMKMLGETIRDEKIILMNVLAQNSIEGDEEQVRAFLESDENNLPEVWYTPDGPLTAEEHPSKYALLQKFLQTYLKKSIIEDSKNNLDVENESEYLDATDLTDSDRKEIDKQEQQVVKEDTLDDEFLLSDQNIEEILSREHAGYVEEQQLKNLSHQSKVVWGRGKAITRARRKLYEKYIELTTPEQREKIKFDAWLNKNVGRRYEIAKILETVDVDGMLYNLKLREVVLNPIERNTESGQWKDKEFNVQVIKVQNTNEDPFWQVKYNGKDVYDIMGSANVTDNDNKSIEFEKQYSGKKQGVDAETRAEIAAKAFVEYLKNKSTIRNTFTYDGVSLYPGQTIYNKKTKKEYQVNSNTKPEEIKNGKVLVIYPLEGKGENKKASRTTSIEVPEKSFNERYSIGSIEEIIESRPEKKIANTGKLRINSQFSFFPFRASKLSPGDPFYDEALQEAAVEEEKAAHDAKKKSPELKAFDQFVRDVNLLDKDDRSKIKFVISKKVNKSFKSKQVRESSDYYSESVSSPYEITLTYEDIPRAVFVFNAPRLFRPDGTEINPINITKEEVLKLFNVKDIKDKSDIAKIVQDQYIKNKIILDALNDFKGDLNQDFTLDQFLGNVLNNKIDVGLNPGYLTFNSPEAKSNAVKFNDLDYNTVDGENFLIFDIQTRFVINKKGNRVLEKSDRDPIHSFGQNVSERKKIEKEARKHMNSEDGYTTGLQLGRYVAAIKFPNGTWTFVELKGSTMSVEEIEDILFGKFESVEMVDGESKSLEFNGLLQRQQETVSENTKKIKVKLEDGTETEGLEAINLDYNKQWNKAFQDKFYLSGKQGDIIQIGLSNTGVIRVFKSNKKNNKRKEEVYFNHKEINEVKEKYSDLWNQDKLGVLLKLFNNTFNQFQQNKKRDKKNFEPYVLNITSQSFKNSIPKNATPIDLMEATAMSSKEVRTHISFSFKSKTEEDLNIVREKEQIIQTNKNQKEKVEDSVQSPTKEKVVGIELTTERFEQWLANPINLYEDEDDKRILENIAWKQKEDIQLSPQEENIYAKHINEIATIREELFTDVDSVVQVTEEDAIADTTDLENEYDKKEKEIKEREVYYFKGDGREQIIVELIQSGKIKGSVVSDNIEDGFAYELENAELTKDESISVNTTSNQRYDEDRKNGELSRLKKELKQIEDKLNEQEYEADKIVDDFDGDDVQDWYYIQKELDKILPSWIQRKEIAYIKGQAIKRNLTAGKFIMYLHNLSQDVEGTIYTTPIEKIAYHEAFHAVFRLFLTDEQRFELYKEATSEIRSLMRSKDGYNMGTKNNPHIVKSVKKAREVMRLKKSEYAQMDDTTLDELITEEFMADQFAIFKARPRSKKIISAFKSIFNKIAEIIKQVIKWFGNKGSNDVGITLNRLYKDIERGKYVNSNPVDNELTRELRLGRTEELTAYKIKMGDKLKVKRPVIVNGKKELKTRIIDKYFPADQADIIKRTIGYYVTDIARRNEQEAVKKQIEALKQKYRQEGIPQEEWQLPTMSSIIEDAVSMYIELYNPNSIANTSRDDYNDIASSLWDYYLSLQSAKDNIIEAVTKDINENQYQIVNNESDQNESDIEQSSPEMFQKSSNETGGRNQLKNNKIIRDWIGSIGIAQEDMFGNKIINPNAPEDQQMPLIAQVNARHVFDGLLKITEGISLTGDSSENVRKILQKLYEGSKNERQTRAAVKSLFTRIGLNYETDGPRLSDNEFTFIEKLKDKYFLTTVLNVFHQNRINPQIIQKDVNNGGVRIIQAGASKDTDWQLRLWNAEYNKKIPQDGSGAKLLKLDNIAYTGKQEAIDVFDAIVDYYKSEELDESTLLDENFEDGYKKLADRLFASTGIRISPTTIRFNILAGVLDEGNVVSKILTDDQQAFLNAYPNVNPISLEIWSEIRGSIVADQNLFQAWVEVKNDNSDKITQYVDERVGVSGRLVQLARVNSKFDETVGSSIYITADGKMVYLHTLPSLNSEFVIKLNNQEYLDKLKSTPYLENNSLLNSPKFERMSKDQLFLLSSISGYQSKYLDIENGRLVAKGFREQNKQPGVTAGKLSPLQIAAITYNLYLTNYNQKTGEVNTFEYIDPITGETKKATFAQIIPRIQSDSNQIENMMVPVEVAIETDSQGNIIFSDWMYENIQEILKTEYDEAVKQQIHFDDDNADVIENYERIEGYNMEQDQRGFSFEHESWLTISPEKEEQKIIVSNRISRSIPKIENGELLKRIVEEKQKIFIRPEKAAGKYGLAVGRTAIARMVVGDETVDFKITNKGLMQLGVDDIKFEDIMEQLGSSYFTTEEDNPNFPHAISGKGDELIYTNNKSIKDFLMGDVKRYVYEIVKTDRTEKKEPIYIASGSDKWTEKTPENNPENLYVFTENINSLESKSTRVGGGTAVVRGAKNSIGIVTKKLYIYKEDRTEETSKKENYNQDFSDTTEDFNLFKKINLKQLDRIDIIKKGKYLVFPKKMASGLAALPKRFSQWLAKELNKRYNIDTQVKANGEIVLLEIKSTKDKTVLEDSSLRKEEDSTLLDELKKKIRLGVNAPTWEQALKEIKRTNPGYDVNAIAEAHLKNMFAKHLNLIKKLNLDDLNSPLSQAFHTSLAATDTTVGPENIKESLKRLNLKEGNLDHNLAQVYFWYIMQNIQLNRLRLGNQSKMFSSPSQFVKRAKDPKSVNAFIPYIDIDNGIEHTLENFHALIYSEPERNAKYTKKNKFELEEDKGKRNKGEQVKAPQIKTNDSMLYLTLKGFLYVMYGTSMLTKDQQNLIQRLMNGEYVSDHEVLGSVNRKGLAERQSIIGAQKPVYKGDVDQVLLKMAAFTLTPRFTSFKVGDRWVAKNKKMKFLHNLREEMEQFEKENNTIIVAGPASMSKQKTPELAQYTDIENGTFKLSDGIYKPILLDAKNLRAQQTVPTNKKRVTKPTQILNTITNEQDHNVEVILDNGETTTIGEVVKDYHTNVNHKSKVNFIAKQNLLFSFEEAMWEVHQSMNVGKITPELYNMLESARAGLKQSQSKSQTLEFFSTDEKGRPKYELNNTITVEDFENYFMNYFNRDTFSATQTGHNSVLISGHGYAKYKEVMQVNEKGLPIQWRVIRDEEVQRRLTDSNFTNKLNVDWDYDEIEFKINDGIELDESEKLKPGMIYTDRLRHGIIKWKEVDGKWVDSGNRVSEIVMPPHFRYMIENLVDGQSIPDIIAKQIMVRIPTQDKQMTASAIIVDFMDSWQGSSVIAPDELIEIAGWDFDIDKVFQHVKDWYYNFGTEEFVEYGSRKNELAYVDYIRWALREMKRKGSVVYEGYQKWKAGTTKPERQRVISETPKQIQRKWNNWINEEIQLTQEGLKTGKIKRKNIPDYNLEKSRLDFAKRFGYWYDIDTKEFAPKYEPTIFITEKSSDSDILKFMNRDESISLKGALGQIGYPISYDDNFEVNNYSVYKEKNKGLEPYEAAIGNKILDNEFILLGNKGITESRGDRENPIGYDPATLISLRNRFFDLKNREETKAHFDGTILENMEIDDIDAIIRAWSANKDISVGRAVTPAQSVNILTEWKSKIRRKNNAGTKLKYFSFNGIDYVDFSIEYIVDPITNKFNPNTSERKNDVMSAFISLMVDNANELLAAPLGMNRDATSTATVLTGLGVDPIVSILFAINPTIYDLYDKAKNKINTDDPSFSTLLKAKKEELLGWLGIELGKAQYDERGRIIWNGNTSQKRDANKASVEDLVSKEKLDLEKMYASMRMGVVNNRKDLSIEELKQLLQILTQWGNARERADIGFDLGAISGLTNQAPATKEDRIDVSNTINNKLGLEMDDQEFGNSEIAIDLRPILNPSITKKKSPINYTPFLTGYYERYKILTNNLLPATFLRETTPFKKLVDLIVDNKTKNFKIFGSKQINQVNRNVLAYLQTLAYRNRIRVIYPKLEDSLNNALIYHDIDGPIKIKTILDDINNWLKTAGREGGKKSNYLFDKYLFYNSHLNLNNGTGLDMAIFNNTADLAAEEWTKISNSILDLYGSGNNKIKRNLLHLVNYLIVKDGLMFANNSFLQALEPIILEDVLQSDTAILNLFKKKRPSDKDFISVFGDNFQTLSENLLDVINSKHSSSFEMINLLGSKVIDEIEWETTTKKIDMSFADKMIESDETHIYVIGDNAQYTMADNIKDNAGVDNLFSIPFMLNENTFFDDKDIRSNRKIIKEAINKIKKASEYKDGRTIVFHFNPGKSTLGATPTQLKSIRSKSPATLSYIEDIVSKELGYDLVRGKTSYAKQRASESLPAGIQGKTLILNSLAGTSANIPLIEDDSIKTVFTNIRIDKLYEREEKGKRKLIYGKELARAKRFFSRNNIQEVKKKQYKTRKEDLSLSLYKFPLYLQDLDKNPYTGKTTSKQYKLVRVYLDPQSSDELKKTVGYQTKGLDHFYNINKENFLDDMAIGWAAEYVEIEGLYSNQQTDIAGVFPGKKKYEVIADERKIKQAEFSEEEIATEENISQSRIGFQSDIENSSAKVTQTNTDVKENKNIKKAVIEALGITTGNETNVSKYPQIEEWADDMGNLDIMEWYQNKEGVDDFVEDFKKMQKKNSGLTQKEYLDQIEESYKCK